ncbi:hypothetical protein ACFX2G_017848 [Malus domestica]
MHPKLQNFQIFLQSPDLQIPIQTLTLSPIQTPTLRHLKLSVFSHVLPSLYFTLNGKPLNDSTPLFDSQITPLSTLILRIRALGGGGDGGATGAESRDCYLKMYAEKKPDKVDPNEQRLSKWLNCALSNEPLKEPCVMDFLGNVFNKEALVEALLGKKVPKAFGHIKGLKDMISIHLTPITGAEFNRQSVAGPRFQCPITGVEFNGKCKFVGLRTCGHVLSSKALKEIKSSTCLVCHAGFSEADKIVINGNEEEVAALRERMEAEKAKGRVKKVKKTKNWNAGVNGEEGVDLEASRLSGTKHGIDARAVEKASTKLEVNVKVVNGGADVKGANNGGAKRFKAVDIAPANATKEVYASIFTSSRKKDFKETFSCRSLPLDGDFDVATSTKQALLCSKITSRQNQKFDFMVFALLGLVICFDLCCYCPKKMSTFPKSDSIHIREVWSDNLEEEFKLIRSVVEEYQYVAMDTEFPGIVLRPVGTFKDSYDYHYQTLKANVDLLKLIQLGLTFSDEKGNLPTCGTDKHCVWQFNFRDFNPNEDVYASDSIELLSQSGMDFVKNNEKGVDASKFTELLMTSGVVLSDNVVWVTFHSGYDFGYLLKLLTGQSLPNTQVGFFKMIKVYFPTVYDIKHLMRFCNSLHGGLNKLAELLDVERIGISHQAGSDSLLTCSTFMKLKETFFDGSIDKYAGVLYGLGVENGPTSP